VSVEFEAASRAERFGKLLDRRAVDVFHPAADVADGVMVMALRLAGHVARLTVGLGARRQLAFALQVLEIAIDRRERDFGAPRLEQLMDLGSGEEPPFAIEDCGDLLARPGDVFGSHGHDASLFANDLQKSP